MVQPLARLAEQYEILAKVREGGMGEIYKVRHRLLEEVRIVKVLRSQYAGDAQLSARLAREARAAIQLRHPNIVQIFDFTLDETGAGLIVMEYIHGADLKQLIQRKIRPSIALSLEIARQSLRALGFLHRHGFVHRDVSPDNLMLTRDVDERPLVKLIDLGIAKRLDSGQQLTTSGMFLGKYRYASPEHFGAGGADDVEARSDLYTLALVLYELVTGRFPLPGESTTQLVAGHLYQPPLDFAETDPEGRVPEALRGSLLRSLAKDPAQRYPEARDFVAEIEALQRLHPLDPAACEEARDLIAAVEGERQPVPASRARSDREPPGDGSTPAAASPPVPPATAAPEPPSAEVAAIVRRVEKLIDRGALMEADRVLFQAAETRGSSARLAAVRERLDESHALELATKVRTLLTRAEDHARADDYEQALDAVRKAQMLAPASSRAELAASAASYRGKITEQHRAAETARRQRRDRVQELVRLAGIDFEQQRFREATVHLRKALELAPDDSWIRDRLAETEARQEQRLEEQRRSDEARSFLRQAEEAESCRDVLKARLLVARALELTPRSQRARAMARELDRRPIEPVLPPEADKALQGIQELRARGERLHAWHAVQAAIEELGEIEPFKSLRKEIADDLLEGET